MAKKKRTYNTNLVKAKHSYSILEIAELFGIHHRTVQSWLKQGLNVIDRSTKPYLIIGEELKRFLKARIRERKHPLKANEFFCVTCNSARKSLPLMLTVENTNRKFGKKFKQVFLRGICEVCEQPLIRFSSDRKLKELVKNGLLLSKQQTNIIGCEDSSLNTDIKKGGNDET